MTNDIYPRAFAPHHLAEIEAQIAEYSEALFCGMQPYDFWMMKIRDEPMKDEIRQGLFDVMSKAIRDEGAKKETANDDTLIRAQLRKYHATSLTLHAVTDINDKNDKMEWRLSVTQHCGKNQVVHHLQGKSIMEILKQLAERAEKVGDILGMNYNDE